MPRSRKQGFTLLEVLVALAVLSIALAAALKVTGQYLDNSAYLRDRTLAQWVALNQLSELRLAAAWPGPGKLEGEDSMAGRAWRWQIQVETTADAELRRLRVRVYTQHNKQPLTELIAFLGLP